MPVLPVTKIAPATPSRAEICGGQRGRREQQVSLGVDRRAIFLFGPGHGRIVAAQPRLDVRDRDGGDEPRQSAAEGARRIALDDQQVGTPAKLRLDRRGDALDVRMRVFRRRGSGAASLDKRRGRIRRDRGLMLPGQDQRRAHAARRQRSGDRGKFDRFGPGADDQPHVRGLQLSP